MKLVWFRSDLRTRDNLALNEALASGPVAALYIATPGQWQEHDDAPIKQDFWRRNLIELEGQLRALGVPLLFAQVKHYADIPVFFRHILADGTVDGLYLNAEYPLNEARRDQAVASVCEDLSMPCRIFHDQVLLQPGSVLNGSGEPFKVFTPFSRKCRTMMPVFSVEDAMTCRGKAETDTLFEDYMCKLDDIDWPTPQAHWETLWPAGETHARQMLDGFCEEGIQRYHEQRDLPAVDGTSMLSPWLNAGVLSIRDCWQRATLHHQGEGPTTWTNELLWREFYRHIMFHYPHVSMSKNFRPDYDHVPWRDSEEDFQQWCEGRTGIPVIDAAMRQLLETGWMHNRLRMITAMFLSKHLLIDWRKGERWFMEHLIDGDFAANNGGWQWSASTGTDAVPYFRVFNPVTQSQRFDGNGEFIRRYLPALAELDNKSIHQPGLLRPDDYPLPMVDLKAARARALAAFKR